jgi:hypothetical protein
MTTAAITTLLVSILGSVPTILPLVQKLIADIAAGKGNQIVSQTDLDELVRLAALNASAIYAKEGVTPPPPAA